MDISDFQFGLIIGVFITLSIDFAIRAFRDIVRMHQETKQFSKEINNDLVKALNELESVFKQGKRGDR